MATSSGLTSPLPAEGQSTETPTMLMACGSTTLLEDDKEASPSAPPCGESRSQMDKFQQFSENWFQSLNRDDFKSLAVYLCCHLVAEFSFTETHAAEYAAKMVGKGERTV